MPTITQKIGTVSNRPQDFLRRQMRGFCGGTPHHVIPEGSEIRSDSDYISRLSGISRLNLGADKKHTAICHEIPYRKTPHPVIPEDRKTMRFSAYVFHLSGISRIKRGVVKKQKNPHPAIPHEIPDKRET